MIQTFIYTSKNSNSYIYDDQHRLSLLIHPELEKAFDKMNDTNPYYLKKYTYLKDHGFFSEPKFANFKTAVNESMVIESIIQTHQIVFETTDFCNLNCLYCSFGELYQGYDMRNFKNINTQNAVTLLKYIFELNPKNKNRNLSIAFYGGEPLLNINFIKEIVDVVNQLNAEKEINISYLMTTNATLLHKHIDYLVANKFRVLVSLDGNKENHSYRIFKKNDENSFHQVIENIDMIQRDYSDYFNSYVNFNAVLHNRNSVKEIYDFIYTRYHKIPRIAELSSDDINPNKKVLLDRMLHRKSESEAEYQKDKSNLLNHVDLLSFKELTDFLKYYSINFYVSNVLSLLKNEEKNLPTNTCFPFSKKIYLTNRNKLLPCERINYKYSMGEVNHNVIIDIPKITQQLNFYYEQLKNVCQSCYTYKFCGLCMFQVDNLDKLDTEKFICDRFHNLKAFKNKLNRIFSFLENYPNDFSQIIENVVIT